MFCFGLGISKLARASIFRNLGSNICECLKAGPLKASAWRWRLVEHRRTLGALGHGRPVRGAGGRKVAASGGCSNAGIPCFRGLRFSGGIFPDGLVIPIIFRAPESKQKNHPNPPRTTLNPLQRKAAVLRTSCIFAETTPLPWDSETFSRTACFKRGKHAGWVGADFHFSHTLAFVRLNKQMFMNRGS